MTHVLILAIGFVLLIKGADWLVDGACSLARSLGISHLVTGLTVVAFGTSFPELFVNISASAHNNPAIAIGNILGSNIANILLILGICVLVCPLKVVPSTAWKEIPFTLLAAVLVLLLVQDDRWGVGSNIFNIFFIPGISAVIRPLPFHAENQVDTLVMIAASLVLFLCLFVGIKRVLGRWEGVLFLVLYAAYTAFLIRTRIG